jgi:hypothetical protein
MNKKFLLALPLSVLAVACAQQPPAEKGECSVVNVPDVCTGSKSNPVLSITLIRNGIRMGPRNVCANAGTEIEVSIHPPQPSTGTVKTVPKNPLDSWLNASNDKDSDSFTIHVPEDAEHGAEFDYTIIRSNGVCLDPRIKIP